MLERLALFAPDLVAVLTLATGLFLFRFGLSRLLWSDWLREISDKLSEKREAAIRRHRFRAWTLFAASWGSYILTESAILAGSVIVLFGDSDGGQFWPWLVIGAMAAFWCLVPRLIGTDRITERLIERLREVLRQIHEVHREGNGESVQSSQTGIGWLVVIPSLMSVVYAVSAGITALLTRSVWWALVDLVAARLLFVTAGLAAVPLLVLYLLRKEGQTRRE